MHQKMERMSQGARPQASAAPPVKWNERLQLSRKAYFKNQGTLENFSDHKPQSESRHLSRWCCSLLSETFLLQAWGQVLLFNLEGRGINAYSTLLKSRLLNYYFLGFKDRSQRTMKEPLGWHNCLCKGFYDHLSLYDLFKLKCLRHGLNIWALSRVGLIMPFLEVRMRKQRLTVGSIAVYSNRLRVKPMGMEVGPWHYQQVKKHFSGNPVVSIDLRKCVKRERRLS